MCSATTKETLDVGTQIQNAVTLSNVLNSYSNLVGLWFWGDISTYVRFMVFME